MARYEVNRALFDFKDVDDKRTVLQDKEAFFSAYRLTVRERQALVGARFGSLLDLGALPNLVFKYYMAHGLPPERYADNVRADRAAG